MRSSIRHIGAVVAALAIAGTVAGCGSGRSVAAYCAALHDEGTTLRAQATTATSDPLGGLIALFSVPQDLAVFLGKLDQVAPTDIEPDVAVLHDSLEKQLAAQSTSTTNTAGGLASNLVASLSAARALQRVDAWTVKNCK